MRTSTQRPVHVRFARPVGLIATLAGLAALALGLIEPRPRQPNVIIVMADTLRADHLSLFGYARETSPQITALARGGVAFSSAISQAPYTSKSIEALFTGDLPSPATAVSTRELPGWRETLAEHFRAAGYQTAGFSGNPLVSRATGHAQGFDEFEMESLNYRPATDLFGAALDWLSEHDAAQPFFLYVHCMDVHAPTHLRAATICGGMATGDRFSERPAHVMSSASARTGSRHSSARAARVSRSATSPA
jgi:membrane-anchored protein YejM (alkaline phosphatase superfamily)